MYTKIPGKSQGKQITLKVLKDYSLKKKVEVEKNCKRVIFLLTFLPNFNVKKEKLLLLLGM